MKGFDSRSTLGHLLRVPLKLVPRTTIVPVLSGPMRGMRWVVGSMPHGAWLGTLERGKLSHFINRLRAGMTVWDIGANVGLYTLPSTHAAGSTVRVYAFEPLPRNLEYLRQHVLLNHLINVLIVPSAVGDAMGVLQMAEGDSPSEFHVDPRGDITVPDRPLHWTIGEPRRVHLRLTWLKLTLKGPRTLCCTAELARSLSIDH